MLPTSNTMKAIALTQAGSEFTLATIECDMPTLGDNEVLIAIDYVALNHLDAKVAATGHDSWHYPHVLGLDAVGTIVDAAKGVFPNKGARVMFHSNLAQQGVLKQYAAVPSHAVCEVADALPSDVAVLLPNSGMSALLALEKFAIKRGRCHSD